MLLTLLLLDEREEPMLGETLRVVLLGRELFMLERVELVLGEEL